jgi:3-phenylpropionate/cinnamic acid dioxygenase small subunit
VCDPVQHEVEQFLYREAALLDGGRFAEWSALFCDDAEYWAPMSAGERPVNPDAPVPALLRADRTGRAQRIAQFETLQHHSQIPPSRTLRALSNVVVSPSAGIEGELTASCTLLISEVRPGDHRGRQLGLGVVRIIPARCEYRLVRQPELKILEKRVDLLTRDLPQENLTFLL